MKVRQEGEKALNDDGSEVQKQIMMHFSKLHGLLQLQEDSILEQLKRAQRQTTDSLVSIGIGLEENIQEMENLLTQCKASLDNKNFKNIPVMNLVEKLKNITEMPCYLSASNTASSSEIQFNIEEDIVDQLKNHCKLSLPEKIEFELLSKSNLPEDYEIGPIPEHLPEFINFIKYTDVKIQMMKPAAQKVLPKPEIPQSEAKTKKPSGISMQELLRKNRQSLKGPIGSLSASPVNTDTPAITPLGEGKGEAVEVCHLNSPSDFYVLRKSCLAISQMITKHLSKQSNIRKDPPAEVSLGEMYIAQFSEDRKWYRCVVKEFRPGDMCLIHYSDYGNTEIVHKNRLRELSEEIEKIPGLAYHCKLYGCSPVGGVWSPEATQQMVRMVANAELHCSVEMASSELLEVRLRVKISKKEGSKESNIDKDYEINQALVFLDMAVEVEDIKSLEGCYQDRRRTRTFSDITIPKDDVFDATVSHIVSPSEFFIQKRQHLQFLKDFDQMYSRLGPNDSLIYHPTPGMAVAVKSEEDSTWKRGVVVGIPKHKTVTVKMIDYGNEETVFWKNVRILDKFYWKTATQAIRCKLIDVAPKFETGWTKIATAAFQKLAPKNKVFKVYVEEVTDTCLKVLLYDTCRNKEIIINGKLVEMGHARSVGPSSSIFEYPTGEDYTDDKTQEGTQDDKDSVYSVPNNLFASNSSRNLTLTPQDELLRGIIAPSCEGSVISERSQDLTSEPEMSTAGSTKNSEQEGLNSKQFKVQAVKIVSPAEIYVTTKNLQKCIEKLKADMTDFYGQYSEEEQPWKVSDLCAAPRREDCTWYRGVVREVSSDTCKVFLTDIAALEELEMKDLRTLKEQFMIVPDITYKCFLTGIIPPGGMSTWPGSTNDMLRVLVSNHPDLYIQPGQLEDGVLPVQLYSKIEKVAGALEPAKIEYVDLSKKLKENGLALPQKMLNQQTGVSTASNHLDSGYVLPNFDAQKPKVQEWLQHEFEAANAQLDLNQEQASEDSDILEDPRTMKRAPPKRDQKHKRPAYVPANKMYQKNQEVKLSLPRIPTKPQSTVTEWLPAEPFKKLEFVSYATNVDYDCFIYIQDLNASRETLKLLKEGLLACFETSHPKPHDLIWTKGQICVAKFDVDGCWYRAKVMEVAMDHVKVLFVDYGNVEDVKPYDMRKDAVLHHIPVQCHKCQPVGMIPISEDGKWPEKVLDFIHAQVVEKECRIKLKPPVLRGDYYTIVEITLPSGETLLQTLTSLNFAKYVVDCEALALELNQLDEIEAFDSDPAYPSLEDPLLKDTEETNAGEEFVFDHDAGNEIVFGRAFPLEDTLKPLLKETQETNAGKEFVFDHDAGNEIVFDHSFPQEDNLKSKTDCTKEIIANSILPSEVTIKAETGIEDVAREKSPNLHSLPGFPLDWYDLAEKSSQMEPTLLSNQLCYKSLHIPESIVEMLVEVGVVVNYNSVRVRIVECDDQDVMNLTHAFADLQAQIQEEAENLLPLVKPVVGLPCIGCFTEDSEWYRAEIMQVYDDNRVKVHYVDYGNEEEVSVNRLREIKVEYLAVPAQSILVFLHNIVKGPDYNLPQVKHLLANSCFQDNPYTMVFERKYPELEVSFYNSQSDKPYQQLLDYQLLSEL